jgi:hypothetical protein
MSLRFVPHFKGTLKLAAEITAQAGVAEGGFVALLPIARVPGKADVLRTWMRDTMLPELLATRGMVNAWYAERNGAAVASATQDHLRTTDRILDGLLVVESISDENLSAAVSLARWDRLRAHGGAPDAPAARLHNVYTLHLPPAALAQS